MRSLAILLAAGLALSGCAEEPATMALSRVPAALPLAEPEPPPAEVAVDHSLPNLTPDIVLPDDAATTLVALRLVEAAGREDEMGQCAQAALAAAGASEGQPLPFGDPPRLRASLALARHAAGACPEGAARELGDWLGAGPDT